MKAVLKFNLDDFADRRKLDRVMKTDNFLDALNEVLNIALEDNQELYIKMLLCLSNHSLLEEVNCHHYDEWLNNMRTTLDRHLAGGKE